MAPAGDIRLVGLRLLPILALACSTPPPTQTVVIIYAEPDLFGAEATGLRVTVRDHDQRVVFGPDLHTEPFEQLPRRAALARIPLTARGADALRTFDVEAELVDAGGDSLALLRVGGGYVRDEIRYIHAAFDTSPECAEMSTTCPRGQTCFEGRCVGSCYDATRESAPPARPSRAKCNECARCERNACQAVEEGAACGCAGDACEAGECLGRGTRDVWTGLVSACSSQDEDLYCWGYNQANRTGLPNDSDTPIGFTTATRDDLDFDIAFPDSVALGSESGCVVYHVAEGAPRRRACWGYREKGAVGIGAAAVDVAPVTMAPASDPVQSSIVAGAFHVCGLDEDAQVHCWGWNHVGQCAQDTSITAVAEPSPVATTAGATQLGLGRLFSCARLVNGRVECWGRSGSGELGDGSSLTDEVIRPEPRCVVDADGDCIEDFTSVDCDLATCCGIRAERGRRAGSLWCWGGLSDQGLGEATSVPVRVTQQLVTAASVGTSICAIGASGPDDADVAGPLYCWGSNAGGGGGSGDDWLGQ